MRVSIEDKGAGAAKSAPVGRIYRMEFWFKAFAVSFLAIGLALLGTYVRDFLFSSQQANVGQVAIGLVIPIVGAGMTIKAFSARITFTADAIERSWAMGRQRMALDAICGRREYVVRSAKSGTTHYLRLESNDGSGPLDFGKKLYRFDDAFWQWFNELPDLDARDNDDGDPAEHQSSNFGLV